VTALVALAGYVFPVANKTPKSMVTFHTAIWPHKKKYWESLNDISAVRFMNIRAATEWTDWRRIHNQNIITP